MLKLYTCDCGYKGGVAIMASSREEASNLLAAAEIEAYYDVVENHPNWRVEPSRWIWAINKCPLDKS